MLRHAFVEDFGINYLLVQNPFSLDELYQLIVSTPTDPIPPRALCPVLMDLREVDLGHFTEAEIRRHMMRKSQLDPRLTRIPCAYVVRNLRDYSMVHLANIFSELSGVNSEDDSLVTEHLSEALVWLLARGGKAKVTPGASEVQEAELRDMAVPLQHAP